MDSRWHLLEPRDSDPQDVISAKLLQLERLVQICETRLKQRDELPEHSTRASPVEQQQPADEANALSQHVIGTADSAESPFRIKRKDAQPKKGALGFRPLLRSSSKPSQSVRNVAPARSFAPHPELPIEEPKADSLPGEHQLSPSAFQTPAITRSLPQLGAQLSSDVPTEKAGGTALPTSMPEPAHNPRPWGRLQLQQHDTKAALNAQHLQQLPDSGQRVLPGSSPLQEMSTNSSGWLAPERPRGFQGKLRLRKNRSGIGALKRGLPAAASGQSGLQAPSEAASAPAQTAQAPAHDTSAQQDADMGDEGMAAAASSLVVPGDRAHAVAGDAQDLVDITPEQPQWRSKQSSRLQQLAESAPARRLAGSGRLLLVQQLLTHPLQHPQHSGDPLQQQHGPEQLTDSLGLSLEHPQGQQKFKSSSSIAISRLQGNSSSSGSLQRLGAAAFVPETCAQACEAVPDTPDCRASKQSLSVHSPVRETPLNPVHLQQESVAEHRLQSLHGASEAVSMQGSEPGTENAHMRQDTLRGACDINDSSCRRNDSAASGGDNDRATHGSKYYFGKPVVSASASACGRHIAVCLKEQGSASCSVQVWSMREEGCALGALLLSVKGTLKASIATSHSMQQLLAVSSAEDRVVLASSAMLALEGCGKACVSVLAKAEHSVQPETLSLPTQQETTCVYISSSGHLFAAGQGGHVYCWSLGDGSLQAAPPCQQLPAASFGGIKFPDIQHLESSGKDCILGCSSIGSVALWNFTRGELLMARQEAGHLLHGLQCLPSACLPQLAGQPPGKRPGAALALAQRRSGASGVGMQQHLALALMWPEQIAVSVLSEAEAVTHFAVAGMYAGLALAPGVVRLVDLQKGTRQLEYGGMHGIRGLAAAGPKALLVYIDDSLILLDCFQTRNI